jgi:hypothetical protein
MATKNAKRHDKTGGNHGGTERRKKNEERVSTRRIRDKKSRKGEG